MISSAIALGEPGHVLDIHLKSDHNLRRVACMDKQAI